MEVLPTNGRTSFHKARVHDLLIQKIPGIKKYNFGKLSQSFYSTLVFDVVGFNPDSHTTFSVFQHRYDGGGI